MQSPSGDKRQRLFGDEAKERAGIQREFGLDDQLNRQTSPTG